MPNPRSRTPKQYALAVLDSIFTQYGEEITDAKLDNIMSNVTDICNITGQDPYAVVDAIAEFARKRPDTRRRIHI